VICEFYYDPGKGQVVNGLNLVKSSIVLPHHTTFGRRWAPRLLQISDVTLIGIDEQTGMIDDGSRNAWSALGGGAVTLYRNGQLEVYQAGNSFSL